MKEQLTYLRKKYKAASKEIFQMYTAKCAKCSIYLEATQKHHRSWQLVSKPKI